MSKESFPTTSFPTDGSEQSTFVELLLADFSAVLNRGNEPLVENREYMQLTELKFLIKNIRELTAIQLFQSYSRSDTITVKPSINTNSSKASLSTSSSCLVGDDSHLVAAGVKEEEEAEAEMSQNSKHPGEPVVKRACTDRLLLFNKRLKIDAILADLKTYVEKRLALAQSLLLSSSVRERERGDRSKRKDKEAKGESLLDE